MCDTSLRTTVMTEILGWFILIVSLFAASLYLASMLFRLLVVVDAHEKDQWYQRCLVNILVSDYVAEFTVAFIDICSHSFKLVAGVISPQSRCKVTTISLTLQMSFVNFVLYVSCIEARCHLRLQPILHLIIYALSSPNKRPSFSAKNGTYLGLTWDLRGRKML